MTQALSAFGRRLREHIKEHRPNMYAELERAGRLEDYLIGQQELYERTFEWTEDRLKAEQPPPQDFLERVAYETRIHRIAREIAFAEAWPKTEEDQPALGEDTEADPSSSDQHEPKPFRRPFYTGTFSSGRKRRERPLLHECVYRSCGALVQVAFVLAVTTVTAFGIAAVVELWNLIAFLNRYDWNLRLVSLLIDDHWARASALLDAAYAIIVVFGGFGAIVSAIAVLVTGETVMADLLKSSPRLARLLRADD